MPTSVLVVSVVFGIQLFCWMLFGILFKKRKISYSLDEVPGISIIVCAHDEEENLKELVPLLMKQDHPKCEIIIVDDRSNDSTFDFLHMESKNFPKLRIVRVTSKPDHINGKKFALTLGIKASSYDIVLLTDADCRPASSSWAAEMAAYFMGNASIVLGYSPYYRKPGLLNSLIRFETLVTAIQYFAYASLGQPYMGVGRNLAYRKKIFFEGKGFNSHLSIAGGDDDLFINEHSNKKNVTLAYGRNTLVYSKPKTGWSSFFYQKVRHLIAGKRYKTSHRIMLAPFMLSWTLVYPTIIAMVLLDKLWSLAGYALLARLIIQVFCFIKASRSFQDRFEVWKIPFLDLFFGFYYLFVGLVALFSKRVSWKI